MKKDKTKYINPLTEAVSTLLPTKTPKTSVVDKIDWKKKKIKKIPLEALRKQLLSLLNEREWFVTGNVEPSLFSDDFSFQDPDVKIKGIENYARGVNRLFDQSVSRAEIISIDINKSKANTLTVAWRLSGRVNIGLGLNLKPFIVYTELLVCEKDGLIIFQEDKFSIPGYDILLSALFPFLVSLNILEPPAPSIDTLLKK
jgi:hypothetical protein